ncbi:unnamed protein product [Nesidiocoris tenuis]|uniref:LIM zinc-binding domain-containing protein n=1 Tax=Nesidiocoris tenuis TaxID=355587 RepID=A0A6H5GYN5_9HEMI|nr:unnamed protein product [Nesidiocoris tenuis]
MTHCLEKVDANESIERMALSRGGHNRYMLKALDLYWHEDCLKCGCCDCRLGEVGSTLYTKANLILCRRDYLRLFGSTGYCSACSKIIPAFEMVMRARTNVYHLECEFFIKFEFSKGKGNFLFSRRGFLAESPGSTGPDQCSRTA